MRTIEAASSALLLVDLQARLMPAIAEGPAVLREAKRLRDAAALCGVPALFTEQNPGRLGGTVPKLGPAAPTLPKMCFDAGRAPSFDAALPDRATVLLAGAEAHVCVLQTALGLLDRGRRAVVVEDAVGSTSATMREAASCKPNRPRHQDTAPRRYTFPHRPIAVPAYRGASTRAES